MPMIYVNLETETLLRRIASVEQRPLASVVDQALREYASAPRSKPEPVAEGSPSQAAGKSQGRREVEPRLK